MTAATKKKLAELNQTVTTLNYEQEKKQKLITYLIIGVVGVAVLVLFFVFIKKRRK